MLSTMMWIIAGQQVSTPLPIPTLWLLAEYLLDGNANDTSGNGNNGTATDITYVTPTGASVQVAQWSSTGRISIPDLSLSWSSGFTFSCVFYFDAGSTVEQPIWYNHSGDFYFRVRSLSGNNMQFAIQDTGSSRIVTSSVLSSGWYHMTMRATNNGSMSIHLNNSSIWSTSVWTLTTISSGLWNAFLLAWRFGTSENWQEKMALCRFYNRELNTTEIWQLYTEATTKIGF